MRERIKKKIRYLLILLNTLKLINNKSEILIYRYIKKSGQILIKLNNGFSFYINEPMCLWAFWEIYSSRDYDLNVPKAATIIDIGAHIGMTSLYFVDKYPNCRIYAYEPNSMNYKLLKKNLRLNKVDGVSTYQKAVTNKSNHKVKLIRIGNSLTSYVTNCRAFRNSSKFNFVRTIDLESIIKGNKIKKVDILKVDCEGEEYNILLNLRRGIYKTLRSIVLEYHRSDLYSYVDLVKVFRKNKFKVRIKKSEFFENTGMIYAINKNKI